MRYSPQTIPIAFVHSMLHGARAIGKPVEVFLADANIGVDLLAQANSRITATQYVALFKSLVERLDDDLLGLQSRPLRRGSFALIARSAIGAPTLDVAIRRIARTYRLLQDDVLMELRQEGALVGFSFRFVEKPQSWPIFLHELLLRVFWRLLAWLIGGKLQVDHFDFAYSRPPYAESYCRVFPAAVAFDCAHSAFWFDAACLQYRIRQDERSLFQFLANAQANIIAPQRNAHSLSVRVRNHLQQTPPQLWPDLVTTADAMHMSSSTLQRHLATEGSSYQALKDGLRRDLAIVRLSTSTIPLAALADELGFADSATFHRAFKGWTGSPPGAYRRNEESR